MSYFYSLRGWLEIEPEKFQTAIRLIESLQHTHKQNTKIGADVTQFGIELFEDTLSKLIDTQLNISGYFHAQGEDEEKNLVYRVTDDKLCIELGNILI